MIKSVITQWQLNSPISDLCDFSRKVMTEVSLSLELYSYTYNKECDYRSKKFNI